MNTELFYLLAVMENYKYPLHNITVKMLIDFIKEAYEQQEYDKKALLDRMENQF